MARLPALIVHLSKTGDAVAQQGTANDHELTALSLDRLRLEILKRESEDGADYSAAWSMLADLVTEMAESGSDRSLVDGVE